MSTIEKDIEPLVAGDHLTWEEFIRRWEAMPEIKRAELIGGRVFMGSPDSLEHGKKVAEFAGWTLFYQAHTIGAEAATSATWRMSGDSPQPDVHLRIADEYDGKSKRHGLYVSGAPELAIEVSLSSTSHDLFEKMDLYKSAGVDEYLVLLLRTKEIRWHGLKDGKYVLLKSSSDGTLRSIVFPGLWLSVPALLSGDMRTVLSTLEQGLKSKEHAAFVEELARRKTNS